MFSRAPKMREGAIGIDFGTTNSSIAYANNSDEHPNLIIWKPSACTGCAGAIFADFTWQASREEYERALGFDFSCITRFHECRTPDEFLPTAAQVLKVDEENRLGEMVGKIPCDTRCARILGRDSDFVEVVRIKRVNRSDGKITIADYELMKALKGKTLNTPSNSLMRSRSRTPATFRNLFSKSAVRELFTLARFFSTQPHGLIARSWLLPSRIWTQLWVA